MQTRNVHLVTGHPHTRRKQTSRYSALLGTARYAQLSMTCFGPSRSDPPTPPTQKHAFHSTFVPFVPYLSRACLGTILVQIVAIFLQKRRRFRTCSCRIFFLRCITQRQQSTPRKLAALLTQPTTAILHLPKCFYNGRVREQRIAALREDGKLSKALRVHLLQPCEH